MDEINSEKHEEIEAESGKQGGEDSRSSQSGAIGLLLMNRLVVVVAAFVLEIAGICMLIAFADEGGEDRTQRLGA